MGAGLWKQPIGRYCPCVGSGCAEIVPSAYHKSVNKKKREAAAAYGSPVVLLDAWKIRFRECLSTLSLDVGVLLVAQIY